MAYSQRWGERRWPEVTPDRDAGPSARTGPRRPPEPREEPEDLEYSDDFDLDADRPVVNPYAVIALVAALVLFFPVAIVFGLIAFTHPRGRSLAFAALLLGTVEAALLVAFVVLPRDRVSDMYSQLGEALGVSTESETAAGVFTDGAVEEATTVSTPPGTQPATPTSAPAPGSAAPIAEKGTACPDPGLIGAATDGSLLLCLAETGSVTSAHWSGPYRIAEAIQEEGGDCSGGADATARTAAGRAVVCEGGKWTLWVS